MFDGGAIRVAVYTTSLQVCCLPFHQFHVQYNFSRHLSRPSVFPPTLHSVQRRLGPAPQGFQQSSCILRSIFSQRSSAPVKFKTGCTLYFLPRASLRTPTTNTPIDSKSSCPTPAARDAESWCNTGVAHVPKRPPFQQTPMKRTLLPLFVTVHALVSLNANSRRNV